MRGEEHFSKMAGILLIFMIVSIVFQQVFLVDRDKFELAPDESKMRAVELEGGDHVKWRVSTADTIEIRLSTDPEHYLFGHSYLAPKVTDYIDVDSDTVYYFTFVNNRGASSLVVRFSVNYNWMGAGLILIAIQIISFVVMLLLVAFSLRGAPGPRPRRKKGSRKGRGKGARRRR
jgi:hypothetical protein